MEILPYMTGVTITKVERTSRWMGTTWDIELYYEECSDARAVLRIVDSGTTYEPHRKRIHLHSVSVRGSWRERLYDIMGKYTKWKAEYDSGEEPCGKRGAYKSH